MRRLLTLLFLFITMLGYSQGTATTGSYWRVTKWTTPFRQALPDSTLVLVRDSVRVYMICHVGGVTGTQTMAYADSAGWVCKFPKDLIGYNTTDSIYAKYSVREARISEWVKNDTIVLDTTFPRLYEGSNITIAGSYPNYTISASGVSLVDSTYVKSGMAIRVDSVGKTYIINNISPDSTKVTGLGTNISVLEPTANNWTIRVTESDSSVTNELDSVYVKYADSTRSGWVRNDTIFIDTSGARAMLPQGLNSVMAIDSNTFHQYQGFVWGKRAGIHLQNFSNAPAISLTRASEDATIADSVIAALWGGGSTGYWDGTMLWNKYLKDSAKVVQFNYKKAKLEMRASQTWDQVHNGTYFSFMTTHNDSIIPRDRMKIGHNGNITFLSPGQASSFDSVYVKDVSTGNMKTVYKSSVGAITDSTHIKAGNGIRVDSTGKTFTIVNISRDSTYIKAGTNVTVDSSGNTYTINSSSWPSKDSTYVRSGTNIQVDSSGNTYTINTVGVALTDSTAWIHNEARGVTYLRNDGDSVGIGTIIPDRLLEVDGTAKVRDSIWIGENNWITHEETGGLTTNQNFNGRTLSAWGMKSADHLLRLGNDYSIWGTQDSSVVVTTKGNLVVGDNSEKNYRLYVNGTIAAPSLTTAASEDTIIGYKASTGEFIAIPTSAIITGGTVTSIGLVGSSGITVAGTSPITTFGTWTLTVDDTSATNELQDLSYVNGCNTDDIYGIAISGGDTAFIPVFSGTTCAGLVPGVKVETDNKFLSAEGTWQEPSFVESDPVWTAVSSQYRTLSNHDSLSALDEKSYNSLTDKPDFIDPSDTVGMAKRTWVIAQDSLAKQGIRSEYINHDSLVKQNIRTEYVNHDSLVKSGLRSEYINHDSLVKSGIRSEYINHDSLLAQYARTRDALRVLIADSNKTSAGNYVTTKLLRDSLNIHWDTLVAHNTRINEIKTSADTLTASVYDSLLEHRTDLTAIYDSLERHTDTLQSHNIRINNLKTAIYDSLDIHWDSLISHNTRINQKRNLSDHDSLSALQERSYESLTNKPVLSVTSDAPSSAVISSDSSDVILTAGPYNTLTVAGSEVTISTDTSKLITRYDTAGFATLAEVNTRDSLVKQGIRTEYINHDSLVKSGLRSEYINHDSLVKSGIRSEYVNHDSLVKSGIRSEYVNHDSLVQQYARSRDALKVSKADSNINGSYVSKKYADAIRSAMNDSVAGKIYGSGTTGYIPKFSNSKKLADSPIYTNGTNVGIGTTNPTTQLELYSAGMVNSGLGTLRLTATDNTKENFIRFDKGGNKWWVVGQENTGAGGFSTDDDFTFYNANGGNWVMTLKESGNVGIRTTNPTTQLDVNGTGRYSGALSLRSLSAGTTGDSILVSSGTVKYLPYTTFALGSHTHSYESLTSKPSLTVTADAPSSALITIDSASAILTADSGLLMTLAGNEISIKNTKRTLTSLDERSYNSLTDKPTSWAISAITNLQDSLNDRYRRKDTTIILSRERAAKDYEPKIAVSTTDKYWRGDKTWQAFPSYEPPITKGDIIGTANQVIVTGSASSAVIGTGVTLSLPQNIHNAASPSFLGLNVGIEGEIYSNYLYSDNYLQAYYRLSDATDSKNDYDLTAYNSPSYASAKYGNGAIMYDNGGSPNASELGRANSIGIGYDSPITVSLWFRFKKLDYGASIFRKIYGSVSGHYITPGVNNLVMTRYYDGVHANSITHSTAWDTTTWRHIVYVWDGANIKMYLDGDSVSSVSSATAMSGTLTPEYVGIGRSVNSGTFYIDDVALFSRALSSTEISALYVGSHYSMPSGIGTANQVLKVPSSGSTLEWGTAGTTYIGGYGINITTDTLKADTSEIATPYDLASKLDKSDTSNQVRIHNIDANGDLIVGAGNNVISRLPRGSTGQLLAVKSDGFLEWITAAEGTSYSAGYRMALNGSTFSNTSYWGTQDSLNVSDGIVVATSKKLSAITNNSTNWNKSWDSINNGVYIPKYKINAKGDIITGTGNDTYKILGRGLAGQVLKVRGDTLYWGTDETGAGGTLTWADTLAQLATDYDVALKQNISDTTTKDATRYWVSQQGYLKWADTTGKLATDYDLDTLQRVRTEVDPVYSTDKSNIAFLNQLNQFTKAQTISTASGSYYPLTFSESGGTTGYLYSDGSGIGLRNYQIGGSGAMLYLSGTTARIYTGVTNEAISVNSDKQLTINAANGTTPIITYSQTLVSNLNADMLDGNHASAFQTTLINPVTGTGNANYLPKFTGTSTIGNGLFYQNNQRIGLGITLPLARLHVKADTAPIGIYADGGSSGYGLLADGPTAIYGLGVDYGVQGLSSAGIGVFALSTTGVALKVDGISELDGYVGINKTTPTSHLDVDGTINFTGNLKVNGSYGTTGDVLTSQGSSDPIWKGIYLDDLKDVDTTGKASGKGLGFNGTTWVPMEFAVGTPIGGGQNNVGMNIGTGIGVYDGKTDTTLQFRKINGVNGITTSLNGTTVEVTLTDTSDYINVRDSNDIAYRHYLTPYRASSVYTPMTRSLTINGTAHNLTTDPSWTIPAIAPDSAAFVRNDSRGVTFLKYNTDKVGIGTIAPTETLTVNGELSATDTVTIGTRGTNLYEPSGTGKRLYVNADIFKVNDGRVVGKSIYGEDSVSVGSIPTNMLLTGEDITAPNFRITPEGGYAVKMVAGCSLEQGDVVCVTPAGTVTKTSSATVYNSTIGVAYNTASASGSVYVVVNGRALVKFTSQECNGDDIVLDEPNAGNYAAVGQVFCDNTPYPNMGEDGKAVNVTGQTGFQIIGVILETKSAGESAYIMLTGVTIPRL